MPRRDRLLCSLILALTCAGRATGQESTPPDWRIRLKSTNVEERRAAVAALERLSLDPAEKTAALTPLLQDPDAAVRAKAVAILLANHDDQAPSIWKEAIQDPSEVVREAAAGALEARLHGEFGIEALIFPLTDSSLRVRLAASRQMAGYWKQLPPQFAVGAEPLLPRLRSRMDKLLAAMEDTNSGVRLSVVEFLGGGIDSGLLPDDLRTQFLTGLRRALADRDPKVQASAGVHLAEMGTYHDLEVLRALCAGFRAGQVSRTAVLVQLQSNMTRFRPALAADRKQLKPLVDPLKSALPLRWKGEHVSVLEVLLSLGASAADAVPAVVSQLHNYDDAGRNAAVDFLARFPEAMGPHAPRVASSLRGASEQYRDKARALLEGIGKGTVPPDDPPLTIEECERALGHSAPAFRRTAAREVNLCWIDEEKKRSVLSQFLGDREPGVRAEAAKGLLALPPLRRAELLRILDDAAAEVRLVLASCESQWPQRAEVLPKLLADGEAAVRLAAAASVLRGDDSAHLSPDLAAIATALELGPAGVQVACVEALASMKSHPETLGLLGSLRRKSGPVATVATYHSQGAAGLLSSPQGIDQLLAHCTDSDPLARRRVLEILRDCRRTGGAFSFGREEQAVSTIALVLQTESNDGVARVAVQALSAFGEASRPAAPVLVQAWDDASREVRLELMNVFLWFPDYAKTLEDRVLETKSDEFLRSAAEKLLAMLRRPKATPPIRRPVRRVEHEEPPSTPPAGLNWTLTLGLPAAGILALLGGRRLLRLVGRIRRARTGTNSGAPGHRAGDAREWIRNGRSFSSRTLTVDGETFSLIRARLDHPVLPRFQVVPRPSSPPQATGAAPLQLLPTVCQATTGIEDFDRRFEVRFPAGSPGILPPLGQTWLQLLLVSNLCVGARLVFDVEETDCRCYLHGQFLDEQRRVALFHEASKAIEMVFHRYDMGAPLAAAEIQFADDGGIASGEIVCRVCGDAIRTTPVSCSRCGTPHHRECWQYAGKCSIFGCHSVEARTTILRNQPPHGGFDPTSPEQAGPEDGTHVDAE